jgi:hypothetical protein
VPKLLVAAMQQIADWLKKRGMSEYAERFADNDIGASVLRDLTDQDLKDIGVALGHRRKLLRAICRDRSQYHYHASSDRRVRARATRRCRAPPAHSRPEGPAGIIGAYQKCHELIPGCHDLGDHCGHRGPVLDSAVVNGSKANEAPH